MDRKNNHASNVPTFSDGDVIVVLSPTRKYQLHSRTLRMNSTLFDELLAEEGVTLHTKARAQGLVIRYRLELRIGYEDDGLDDVGFFKRVELDPYARAVDGLNSRSLEVSGIPRPVYKHYENVIRAFYHHPLEMSDENMALIARDTTGLIAVAEYLGSIKVVAQQIDNALIKQGTMLWRAVSNNPSVWADLALRLKSEMLFGEAIIHMVGQWQNLKNNEQLLLDMHPEIHDLCQRKYEELEQTKKAVELRIISHYPKDLHPLNNNPNVGPGSKTTRWKGESIKVTSYTSEIFGWMALNLFKHWFGQNITMDEHRHASDGGYSLYKSIHMADDAYLTFDDIEKFTQSFPMSAKSRANFNDKLGLLKNDVKNFVDSIMQSRLTLDVTKHEVQYLTCIELNKKDIPWLIKAANEQPEYPIYTQAQEYIAIPRERNGKRSNNNNPEMQDRANKRYRYLTVPPKLTFKDESSDAVNGSGEMPEAIAEPDFNVEQSPISANTPRKTASRKRRGESDGEKASTNVQNEIDRTRQNQPMSNIAKATHQDNDFQNEVDMPDEMDGNSTGF